MAEDTIDEFAESAQECFQQETAGATQDGRIYAPPFGARAQSNRHTRYHLARLAGRQCPAVQRPDPS